MYRKSLIVAVAVLLLSGVAHAKYNLHPEPGRALVDLDFNSMPGSNSIAGQGNADSVVKQLAFELFETSYIGPQPAVTDNFGAVYVSAGRVYRPEIFWVVKRFTNRPAEIVPKPAWARAEVIGTGGVKVYPDGSFSAKSDGFLLHFWYDATKPWHRWAYSQQIVVKRPK